MTMGFHRFSGDGNLINFIAILRINIPVPTGAEAAAGVLRGGGILGFGFMNIAGGPIGHLRAAGTFKLFPVFRANGVAGAAATSAVVRVVKSRVLFILLFLIAIAACRAIERDTRWCILPLASE